jgi:hypothetical protein
MMKTPPDDQGSPKRIQVARAATTRDVPGDLAYR